MKLLNSLSSEEKRVLLQRVLHLLALLFSRFFKR